MKKKDLQSAAGLTAYAINKLSKNEDVTTEILGKICKALDCSTEDIMEFLPDDLESWLWDSNDDRISMGSSGKILPHYRINEWEGTNQDEQAAIG